MRAGIYSGLLLVGVACGSGSVAKTLPVNTGLEGTAGSSVTPEGDSGGDSAAAGGAAAGGAAAGGAAAGGAAAGGAAAGGAAAGGAAAASAGAGGTTVLRPPPN